MQLKEVGDFAALNWLPAVRFIRSTKVHLTTEPPIFFRCCLVQSFFHTIIILSLFTKNHKQNSCDTNEHRIDIK